MRKEWEYIVQQMLLCIPHWPWHRYVDCSVRSQGVLHLYSVHPHRWPEQQGVNSHIFPNSTHHTPNTPMVVTNWMSSIELYCLKVIYITQSKQIFSLQNSQA
jgi:hypothetical protein